MTEQSVNSFDDIFNSLDGQEAQSAQQQEQVQQAPVQEDLPAPVEDNVKEPSEDEDQDTNESEEKQSRSKLPRWEREKIRADQEREKAQSLERQIIQYQMQVENLTKTVERMLTPQEVKEAAEEFAPIDEEAWKRTEAMRKEYEAKLEDVNYTTALAMERATYAPIADQVQQAEHFVLATEIQNALAFHGVTANQLDEKSKGELIDYAVKKLEHDRKMVHKQGIPPIKWTLERAKILGYNPVNQDSPTQPKPSGVNLDAVERARQTAGAPTAKTADVGAPLASFDAIFSSAEKESKQQAKARFTF